MKSIFKYVLTYIFVVLVLFGTLVLTSRIPRDKIYNNLKENAEYYRDLDGIENRRKNYKMIHYYADSMLFNIMNYTDSNKPAESIMEARYYKERTYDSNGDFVDMMDKNFESNEQYIRYWHGSLSILRPLTVIFNVNQIYIIMKVIFWILVAILVVILLKKYKTLAIVLMIAGAILSFYMTPTCFEYTWTVLIALIVSIISLLIEKRGNSKLYLMYFITGILTCYFDFLSTETLTILMPVLLTLLVRYKDNRIKNFKEGIKFIVISCSLWFISYALMWLTKWVLASIILKINAFSYVKDNALLRLNLPNAIQNEMSDIQNSSNNILQKLKTINESAGRIKTKDILLQNISKVWPLRLLTNKNKTWIVLTSAFVVTLLILTILKLIVYLKKKDLNYKKDNIKIRGLLLLIAIIPYVRYIVMGNHSYYHSFFTYRAQLPSIIAIIFIIIYTIKRDIEKIKEKE